VTLEALLFFIVAACAISSAVLMILQRNPMLSAICLIANFFCLALLYLLLRAQLLAVLQIIVYTGAIMVLVIFVIMLLNLGDERRLTEKFDMKRGIGVVFVAGVLLELLYLFGFKDGATTRAAMHPEAETIGTVEAMGHAMFGKFLLPFEITGLLLLAAIIGAVVMARKRA
jgi:NADH-quinone oxidoreductase subunit J